MAAGSAQIPREELTVAAHAYSALQAFYRTHKGFAQRPLYVTGEVGGRFGGGEAPARGVWLDGGAFLARAGARRARKTTPAHTPEPEPDPTPT